MPTIILLTLLAASPVLAHDMWIEPASFTPQVAQIVGLKLRVGQELLGDPIPHNSELIQEFVFDEGAGKKPVVGRPGSDPAGFLRVNGPGLVVAGYASNPSPVDMGAEKFNAYLKEEGLDSILKLRASTNRMNAGVKELFVRCAKALMLSGEAQADGSDRALGFTLELTAQRTPYSMHAGQELPLLLNYRGRPLAGALVVAINKKNASQKITGRTNRLGKVMFALPSGGMWLIKAVHMVAAPKGTGADWMSYWASLTFELPGAPAKRS